MSKQGAERFGQYLAEFIARSSRFANASAFAAEAGVSPSAVSRWLRGKERPAADALPKIAPLIGVSATQLFAIAYPEQADEMDTQPIAPAGFEQALAETNLTEDQKQVMRAIHDQFVAANSAKAAPRRRRTGTRSGDEHQAM